MSGLTISAALLRSPILSRAVRNEAAVAAWESGAITSLPAEQAPKQLQLPFSMGPCGEKARQVRVYGRRAERGRKRTMGGDGKLPNTIRSWFTEGERAVLTVIAVEVKRHGECSLSVAELGKRAGVGVRTVQYALATARSGTTRRGKGAESRPALIHVEYRRKTPTLNDTNVITIVSKEWLLWLRYRPTEAPASGCTELHSVQIPSSTLSLRTRTSSAIIIPVGNIDRSQGALERGRVPARAAPS